MKSLLISLLGGKPSRRSKTPGKAKPYCSDPLSHPDLQRMDLREIGDIYINPEKTQP
ncbi:hypothetical protein PsAD2_02325 [Pseudovibrio axinellae]|uniref:Uncharacterized protein n=1 Tax=Pseudovibrio axinellae TaxID=989403 RepID=A0A165YFW7_9HYPH|nr:hypothetical protein [Pseudovibrio axinellae]KZL18809.1 hypothetical protein PsAD2_02325 [Pseudovibrio axinellae]SEP92051.1 hypothetical protein SAMN05421798_101716 [Pseudovibrio axinellae]